MEHSNWECPKCKNQRFEVDEFRATGSIFSKMFDVQNKRFTTVICTRCRYTEVYSADSSTLGSLFDFFTG